MPIVLTNHADRDKRIFNNVSQKYKIILFYLWTLRTRGTRGQWDNRLPRIDASRENINKVVLINTTSLSINNLFYLNDD